ncbi:MAG: hypothetical protein ACRDQH_00820 [Pseudonocardiaceae bacterium]
MSTAQAVRPNGHLVPEETWVYLVNQIVSDNPAMTREVAERILGQALGFMQVCALRRNGRLISATPPDEIEALSPSGIVDKGWHAIIVTDTNACMAIHARLGVSYLHHKSYNAEQKAVRKTGGVIPGLPSGAGDLALTTDLMHRNGITVDEALWRDELPQDLADMVAAWHGNQPDCYECPGTVFPAEDTRVAAAGWSSPRFEFPPADRTPIDQALGR